MNRFIRILNPIIFGVLYFSKINNFVQLRTNLNKDSIKYISVHIYKLLFIFMITMSMQCL